MFSFVSANIDFNLYSPSYFGLQENVHDKINYLEDEFLSFSLCSENIIQDLDVLLKCPSTNYSIKVYDNYQEDGCFFANYDLSGVLCSQSILEISYTQDNKERKILRTLKKERPSNLINHVVGMNTNFLTSEELSYYLIVLRDMDSENYLLIDEIYNVLKNSRDNLNKCWPSRNCNLRTTSIILRNLKLAGYSHNNRLIDDGLIYLEKNLISNLNHPSRFSIDIKNDLEINESIMCDLSIDSSVQTLEFAVNDTSVDKKASNDFIFKCSSLVNLTVNIYDHRGFIQESLKFENETEISYFFSPFACFSSSDACDLETTLNALFVYGNKLNKYDLLNIYLDSFKYNFEGKSSLTSSSSVYLSSLYLKYKSDLDYVNFIRFNQNNIGSWGSGTVSNKILETAWSILALQKRSEEVSKENVKDAKMWVYENEPLNGWGSIEKNTLAYLSIREQIKPYLVINVENELFSKINFTIENPTVHNLRNVRVSFTEEIDTYLSYRENLGNLNSEEKIVFGIHFAKNFLGSRTGKMKILATDLKNNELLLIEKTINLVGPSLLNFEDYYNVSISEGQKTFSIPFEKSMNVSNLSCSYEIPFVGINRTFEIQKLDKELNFEIGDIGVGNYTFELNCFYEDVEFFENIIVNFEVLEEKFKISSNFADVVSYDDLMLQVTNLVDERKILSFQVEGYLEGVIVPRELEKIVAGGDTRNVFFEIVDSVRLFSYLNDHSSNIVITDVDSGFTVYIPINVYLDGDNLDDNLGNMLYYYIIGGLIFFVILILILRAIRNARQSSEENFYDNANPEYIDDDMYIDEQLIFK